MKPRSSNTGGMGPLRVPTLHVGTGPALELTAHASSVLNALEQAIRERLPVHRGGLVHHSDSGSQYVSIRYSERLAEAGIELSVGCVGDSYDNALAETINGPDKAEVIHR